MTDEDYWNSSQNSGFDFNDLSDLADKGASSQFHIFEDLVSHSPGLYDCLDESVLIIDSESGSSSKSSSETKCEAPSVRLKFVQKVSCLKATPSQTITNMVLGLNYNLEQFKGMKEKISLLESAIKVHDGNAITAVVLFLRSTLRKSLFQSVIMKYPKAMDHYFNFLFADQDYSELIDMYLMAGNSEEAAILKYKLSIAIKNPEIKIKRLEQCLSTHFQCGAVPSIYVTNLSEHINLLERQLPIEKDDERQIQDGSNVNFTTCPKTQSLIDKSVISTLFYCCIYHYHLGENFLASPAAIKKSFQLSDKQFAWTATSALCQLQKWAEIEHLFLNKDWLGKAKRSCCIGFNKVVMILANADAPREIIKQYIGLVDSLDERLSLAKKHNFHKIVMKILISMRDKHEFMKYKAEVTYQTAEYLEVESTLSSSAIKWKN